MSSTRFHRFKSRGPRTVGDRQRSSDHDTDSLKRDTVYTFGYHAFQRDLVQFPSVFVDVKRRVYVRAAVFGHGEPRGVMPTARARLDPLAGNREPLVWTPTADGAGNVTVAQVDHFPGDCPPRERRQDQTPVHGGRAARRSRDFHPRAISALSFFR